MRNDIPHEYEEYRDRFINVIDLQYTVCGEFLLYPLFTLGCSLGCSQAADKAASEPTLKQASSSSLVSGPRGNERVQLDKSL